jgi:hypothetical protein
MRVKKFRLILDESDNRKLPHASEGKEPLNMGGWEGVTADA